MAVYRHIYIDFWQDDFVLELTPEEKYFYLYLMTNSKTTQCGVYYLPVRVIEMETGYNRETCEKLLKRFVEYGKILYDNGTKEVFILNWFRYNMTTSITVVDCVRKNIKNIKTEGFKIILDEKLTKFLKEAKEKKEKEAKEKEAKEKEAKEKKAKDKKVYTSGSDSEIAEDFNIESNSDISSDATNTIIDEAKNIDIENDTLLIPYQYPMDTLSIEYGQKEKEKEKEKEKKIVVVVNNTTNHVEEKSKNNNDDDNISPEKFYDDNIGMITPFISQAISHFLQDGVEEKLIKEYMKQAVINNVLRWSYVDTCIRNGFNNGILTLENYLSHEKDRKRKQNKANNSFANNKVPKYADFKQREYSEDEYAMFYANQNTDG